MRMIVAVLGGMLLAGCQTTADGYSSGINQAVDCSRSKIWTTAAVEEPSSGDCRVRTPTGRTIGIAHTAYFHSKWGGRWWSGNVNYTEPKQESYALAIDPKTVLADWDVVEERAGKLRPAGQYSAGGRQYDLFEFQMTDHGAECLGFVSYGAYKGEGYEDRLDGFICHRAGPRMDAALKGAIDNLTIRQ